MTFFPRTSALASWVPAIIVRFLLSAIPLEEPKTAGKNSQVPEGFFPALASFPPAQALGYNQARRTLSRMADTVAGVLQPVR